MNPRFQDLVVRDWGARYRGQVLPCSVGRGGIGWKNGEGDGISPIGNWRIVGGGYRADRMSRPVSSLVLDPIGPGDIWSDDPKDPAYNHGLTGKDHAFGHEFLRRPDPLYDIFLLLDFNWPIAVPGAGSAIFLHNWRKPRHPTEGCIAFAPGVLRYILETWDTHARVVIR